MNACCLSIKVNDIKNVLLEEELNTTNYKVLNEQKLGLYDYLDAQTQVVIKHIKMKLIYME